MENSFNASTSKDLRKSLNITQKQLAELLGCNERTIRRIESGKPASKLVIRSYTQFIKTETNRKHRATEVSLELK